MSTHSSGTFKQPVSISVCIEELQDKIAEMIKNLIVDAIADQTDDVSDTEIEWSDYDFLDIHTVYSGSYNYSHYAGTREDPPEEDLSRDPENLDFDKIKSYVEEHLPDNIKSLIKLTSIREDDTNTVFDEYEPDWDSMPGGHDDY